MLTSSDAYLMSILYPTCSILLVDYQQFIAQPEQTVLGVLDFIGADTSRWVGCCSV